MSGAGSNSAADAGSSAGGGLSKVRLGVTTSATSKQAGSVIVVVPEYSSIVAAGAAKLKLAPKQVSRVVLRTSVNGHAAGTVLPTTGDCSAFLKNDVLLWLDAGKGRP
jgi:hypothetical protein